jgi:hypothetical protein
MLTGRPFGRADDDKGGERRPNSRPRADWFREEAYRKLGRRVIAVSGSREPMLSEKREPIEIRIADLGHLNAEAILEPLGYQVPMTRARSRTRLGWSVSASSHHGCVEPVRPCSRKTMR